MEIDEDLDKALPQKAGARLHVYLSGDIIADFQEDLNPLRMDEVIQRFRYYAQGFLGESRINEIIEKTLTIESLKSINSLMDLLAVNT